MLITIYGANGFIGKHLDTAFRIAKYQVISKGRNSLQDKSDHLISKSGPEDTRVVINLTGSWHKNTNEQLVENNYDFPVKVLQKELAVEGKLIWIQASSYTQLYKETYFQDYNQYAVLKSLLSEKLIYESTLNKNFYLIDLFMPHVIGPGEHSWRVFSKLALSYIENKSLDMTSGSAIIPISDVRDLSSSIVLIVEANKNHLYSKAQRIYPDITALRSLKAHIEESLPQIFPLCRFGKLSDRRNEFTDPNVLREFYKLNPKFYSLSTSVNDQVIHLKKERNLA